MNSTDPYQVATSPYQPYQPFTFPNYSPHIEQSDSVSSSEEENETHERVSFEPTQHDQVAPFVASYCPMTFPNCYPRRVVFKQSESENETSSYEAEEQEDDMKETTLVGTPRLSQADLTPFFASGRLESSGEEENELPSSHRNSVQAPEVPPRPADRTMGRHVSFLIPSQSQDEIASPAQPSARSSVLLSLKDVPLSKKNRLIVKVYNVFGKFFYRFQGKLCCGRKAKLARIYQQMKTNSHHPRTRALEKIIPKSTRRDLSGWLEKNRLTPFSKESDNIVYALGFHLHQKEIIRLNDDQTIEDLSPNLKELVQALEDPEASFAALKQATFLFQV